MDLNQIQSSNRSKAALKMPDEEYYERVKRFRNYVSEKISKIDEEIYRVEMMQGFTTILDKESGEMTRKVNWTEEAKGYVDELNKLKNIELDHAQDMFWKGYEHLRPQE